MKNVTVPRTIVRNMMSDVVHLHVFTDASNLACCIAAIAVIEYSSVMVKGLLLTSKSRISKQDTSIARLELISGQIVANLAKDVHNTLQGWPMKSITVWMDSMVALYWILNLGKSWKGVCHKQSVQNSSNNRRGQTSMEIMHH